MFANRYCKRADEAIERRLQELGPKTKLWEACHIALRAGGRRFRPSLVYAIGEALGFGVDPTPAALAVEFFHTASLIADDLPCMDDAKMRRGLPALHLLFGESTALLASYALVSAGYAEIGKAEGVVLKLAMERAAKTTGIGGVLGGQFLDLHPPLLDEAAVLDLIEKKTGALFELAFVLGWLFGGGEIAKLPLVEKVALHFGRAFQIIDDFDDRKSDEAGQINLVHVVGEERAHILLNQEIEGVQRGLEELELDLFEILSWLQLAGASSSASVS